MYIPWRRCRIHASRETRTKGVQNTLEHFEVRFSLLKMDGMSESSYKHGKLTILFGKFTFIYTKLFSLLSSSHFSSFLAAIYLLHLRLSHFSLLLLPLCCSILVSSNYVVLKFIYAIFAPKFLHCKTRFPFAGFSGSIL